MSLAGMVGAMVMVINCSSLYAQSVAFDTGPRPVGTGPSINCVDSDKFPGNPPSNCIDIGQPPSVPPIPAADGAGRLITLNGGGQGPLTNFWSQGLMMFETKASVTQQVDSTGAPVTILGLGPSFNAESCFQCHSQPTVGGSSAGQVTIRQGNTTKTFSSQIDPLTFQPSGFSQNPQITIAFDAGATNIIPCFLTQAGCSGKSFFRGPVVETRFIHGVAPSGNTAGVASGSPAELFVFAGRDDAPSGCTISQVDTGTQFQNGNAVFRIPTPTYGLGLVENTSDFTLMSNVAAANAAATALNRFGHINGVFNRIGNDRTISRFGWKAQNSSMLMFAGEAANVEMGVTNELFPYEKTWGSGLGCISTNNYPEDQTLAVNPFLGNTPLPGTTQDPLDVQNASPISVVQLLAIFMRLNAAPSQCNWDSQTLGGVAQCNALDADVIAGGKLFGTTQPTLSANAVGVGCVLCHTDTLTTSPSMTGSLSSVTYHPFSDFALHHMGKGDADFVTQGLAGGDQFRTAPLWGAGQRLFFMHDGRATDLVQAISDHCPAASATADPADGFPAGEACSVVANFNALTVTQKQQLLKFLRSL
jgi:CxxC motif-containing protein (DUF1111 family)